MAMQLGGGGGVKADINVTPLVDVMLVLLIIVMLVAPLVQQGVQLTLPVAGNTADYPETPDQTTIQITQDRRFFINGGPVAEKDLRMQAEEALEGKKERVVFIRADQEVEYSAVMYAMDELRAAGIEDMALITEPKTRQTTPFGGGE
ncbi:MAG: biopolymer transporter ExbD [Acidobacteria bacterium]|nr:biopolymer transporter ExbD [Acidobacteriota bacterium]